MMELLKIGQVANMFGVDAQTIRVWVKDGKLDCIMTPNGHRRFNKNYILGMLNEKTTVSSEEKNTVLIYARVSTKKQADAGNLDRQITRLVEYAVTHDLKIKQIYREIASGIHENRKALQRMLNFLKENPGCRVLIEYKDRLARFGFSYLEKYIQDSGSTIHILDTEEKEEEQELVEDLIAITTSFSARIYGKRGGKRMNEEQIKHAIEGVLREGH